MLKSIFEEQINYEADSMGGQGDYPEAADYLLNYTKSNTVDQYLDLIEESKKLVKIPVIASVNCVSSREWVSFAKKMEMAGANAIELNVYFLPIDKNKSASEYEKIYLDVVEKIVSTVKIPVAVKLGRSFTNPAYMVNEIYKRGAKGVVLFNRFYEPDIDIDQMKIVSSEVFSNESDIRQSLRWIGIVSALDIKVDIAASTGVHEGGDAVKQILAGADIVQVCSTLYKNGVAYLENIIQDMESWMKKNNFNTIKEIKGKMNYKKISDPALYERSQFMKYFSSIQ